ncbi:MAG: PIN domain-containing protein [Alkalispirochaeta sp.]
MSLVLPDTSIWIDFFRGNKVAAPLNQLIEAGRIVTNDLILAELIPSIDHKSEHHLKELMYSIERVDVTIEWGRIIEMQRACLANGYNNVGIPDLIIVQNAIDHQLSVFENDRHFRPMPALFGLTLFRDSGTSNPSPVSR